MTQNLYFICLTYLLLMAVIWSTKDFWNTITKFFILGTCVSGSVMIFNSSTYSLLSIWIALILSGLFMFTKQDSKYAFLYKLFSGVTFIASIVLLNKI